MKKALSFLGEIFKIVIIALLIVVPIRYFLFQPFIVRGASMEPSFHNGDYLLVDELSYRFREPKRGEVVVFESPLSPSQRYIKRVIALPGETIEIEDGKVIIKNGNPPKPLDESVYLTSSQTPGDITITLQKDEYFVLGDNRDSSYDSRRWGPLPEENIIGRVFFRAWPTNALAQVEAPEY